MAQNYSKLEAGELIERDARIRQTILDRIGDRPRVTKKGLAESIGKTATWTHTQLLKSPRSTLRYLIAMEPEQADRLAQELGWFSATHMTRDLDLYPELLPARTEFFQLSLPAHSSLTGYARGLEPDKREQWDSRLVTVRADPSSIAIAKVDDEVYLETGLEYLYGAQLLLSKNALDVLTHEDLAVFFLPGLSAASILVARADQRGVIVKSRARSSLYQLKTGDALEPVAYFIGMVK